MAVKVRHIPCYACKHYKEEQIEQFTYLMSCDLDKVDVFLTEDGCYRFKDRRKKKDRGDPNRKALD